MAVSAANGVVKASGTSVAMADEATTNTSGKTYQVTNASKRILNPAVALVVLDNAVDRTAEVESVDFLFGLVTFKSTYTVTGPVTLTGAYLPTLDVASVRGVNLSVSANLQEASVMGVQAVQRLRTLLDVSGSVERLELSLADLDAGAGGTQSIDGWLRAGTPRVLEWLIQAGYRVRAWVLFESQEISGDAASLVGVNLAFQGAAPAVPSTSYTAITAFSIGA